MEASLRDARLGLRMMRRNPGFSCIAIATLALGIGATTAIFSVANDYLLRPLPFLNSDRIVTVKRFDRKLAQSGWTDPPSFKYWQRNGHVFMAMGAWSETTRQYNLTGAEGPERVSGKQVSSGFFDVLGVKPILGRAFSGAEDARGGEHVVVISDSLWQRRYGRSPDVIGKAITLDGQSGTIIGVLPRGFSFSTTPEDVWVPLGEMLDGGAGGLFLNVIGLLRPGVRADQAHADLETLTQQLERQFPDTWNADQNISVKSLRDRYTRDLQPALFALLAAAGLVLLTACANISNLLLTRTIVRRKEIATRQALGCSRSRLVSQVLVESAILAIPGALGGVLIAFGGVRILYATLPVEWLPLAHKGVSPLVLSFAVAVSLLTIAVFSAAPAWSSARLNLNVALRDGIGSPIGRWGRTSFRDVLVIFEIALAAILLSGTGLLLRSFIRLSAVDLGFHTEDILSVELTRTGGETDAFLECVLNRIAALPSVRAAGAINIGPLSGTEWSQDIVIGGRAHRAQGDSIWASHRQVTPGYFRAMEIPILKGRSFVAGDRDRQVSVISAAMAQRYWPDENAVGKRFGVNCTQSKCNWIEVIGVVGDVKELGPGHEPVIAMYFSESAREMSLIVRATESADALRKDVISVIHSIDPQQPVAKVQTMESIVSQSTAPRRLTVIIASIFAGLALILTVVGLFGVISYSVTQRTREFGIRVALGAMKSHILGMILAHGFRLALIGLAVGLAGSFVVSRAIAGLLFGVSSNDPLSFVAGSVLLACATLLACSVPAFRAIKTDAATALRHE